jgi:hypothetical protein
MSVEYKYSGLYLHPGTLVRFPTPIPANPTRFQFPHTRARSSNIFLPLSRRFGTDIEERPNSAAMPNLCRPKKILAERNSSSERTPLCQLCVQWMLR